MRSMLFAALALLTLPLWARAADNSAANNGPGVAGSGETPRVDHESRTLVHPLAIDRQARLQCARGGAARVRTRIEQSER